MANRLVAGVTDAGKQVEAGIAGLEGEYGKQVQAGTVGNFSPWAPDTLARAGSEYGMRTPSWLP